MARGRCGAQAMGVCVIVPQGPCVTLTLEVAYKKLLPSGGEVRIPPTIVIQICYIEHMFGPMLFDCNEEAASERREVVSLNDSRTRNPKRARCDDRHRAVGVCPREKRTERQREKKKEDPRGRLIVAAGIADPFARARLMRARARRAHVGVNCAAALPPPPRYRRHRAAARPRCVCRGRGAMPLLDREGRSTQALALRRAREPRRQDGARHRQDAVPRAQEVRTEKSGSRRALSCPLGLLARRARRRARPVLLRRRPRRVARRFLRGVLPRGTQPHPSQIECDCAVGCVSRQARGAFARSAAARSRRALPFSGDGSAADQQCWAWVSGVDHEYWAWLSTADQQYGRGSRRPSRRKPTLPPKDVQLKLEIRGDMLLRDAATRSRSARASSRSSVWAGARVAAAAARWEERQGCGEAAAVSHVRGERGDRGDKQHGEEEPVQERGRGWALPVAVGRNQTRLSFAYSY